MAKIGSVRFYIALVVLIIIFLPPFAKYQELRYKNNKLDKDLKDAKAEIGRMEIDKRRLETDITYIEGKTREKIGIVRKGEIILKGSQKKR